MSEELYILKRTKISYLGYAVFFYLFVDKAAEINFSNIEIIDVVNILGSGLLFSILVRIIVNPVFIKIENESLFIFRDAFYSQVLDLNQIVKFKESVTPLSRSYLMLKNGKKVKFLSSNLTKRDLILLETILKKNNIDVV